MLNVGAAIKNHVNLKPKFFNIDNVVFKLHYRVTVWLMLAFAGILCVEEYNKNKIKCTHSDPTDSKKQLEHVINTFCFFMSTYTVPRHHNKTNGDVSYPGVGPAEEDEDVIYHKYYQWVPYVLFFQAISFYLPHLIWRSKEGHRLSELVDNFNVINMLKDKQRKDAHEKVKNSLKDRIKMNRSWMLWLVGCEVLNLINVILQMYLTDLFLGGKFWNLGNLVYEHYGSEEFNPLDMVFPKMAKCSFDKYGPSGSHQLHDVVCVLSLNIINEKIYIVLWYWYIILAVASVIMLLHRILSFALYNTGVKYNAAIFVSELTMKPSSRDLLAIMKNLAYSEWFFLKNIATNLDGRLAVDLIHDLGETFRTNGRKSSDDEEERLLNSSGFKYENISLTSNEKNK